MQFGIFMEYYVFHPPICQGGEETKTGRGEVRGERGGVEVVSYSLADMRSTGGLWGSVGTYTWRGDTSDTCDRSDTCPDTSDRSDEWVDIDSGNFMTLTLSREDTNPEYNDASWENGCHGDIRLIALAFSCRLWIRYTKSTLHYCTIYKQSFA